MRLFKTDAQVVEEIHHEIDTAQDRLLAEARQLIEKAQLSSLAPEERQAERLRQVGFVNTPLARKGAKLLSFRQKAREQVVLNEEMATRIEYYQTQYPFLKFLTVFKLDEICEKYGLIHAPIQNYIADVPDKNLTDIENAQALKAEDVEEKEIRLICGDDYAKGFNKLMRLMGKSEPVFTQSEINAWCSMVYGYVVKEWCQNSQNYTWLYVVKEWFQEQTQDDSLRSWVDSVEITEKTGLFIAAPANNFDLRGLTKKSKKGFFSVLSIPNPDPIVFRYVKGGIQVLTKWGLEANDPALVLPINN